jgi:large subunit ribosomal protein L4
MQAELLNVKGEKAGQIDLQDKIFGEKPQKTFLHEYVTVYLANQRTGQHKVKTRTEVSGGGKKPWKQKHTGRARAGSIRSGLWRHGGIIHGPKEGKVRREFPRQKSRLALSQALTSRYQAGGVIFVDALQVKEAKTKLVASMLEKLGCQGRTILVLDQPDAKLTQAARNIPNVEIMLAGDLNAYMVLRSKKLVMTRSAVEKLGARWN